MRLVHSSDICCLGLLVLIVVNWDTLSFFCNPFGLKESSRL